MIPDCPLCRSNNLLQGPVLAESASAYLIKNPFSDSGNYLIIPSQHIESLQSLGDSWWADMKALLGHIPELGPNYNISLNYGELAGQTIPHLHFWVVPRHDGGRSTGKGLVGLINELDSENQVHS